MTNLSSLNGVIEDLGDGEPNAIFDHRLLPFLGAAVYLRLVTSLRAAMVYAAGGFHGSVTRGEAGGTNDPANQTPGYAAGEFALSRLERDDIGQAWSYAAQKYKDAYDTAQAKTDLATVKRMLAQANELADAAYALEKVEPPRDPGTGTVEPPHAKDPLVANTTKKMSGVAMAGFGLLGIVALLLVGNAMSRRQKKMDQQKMLTGMRRPRRRR